MCSLNGREKECFPVQGKPQGASKLELYEPCTYRDFLPTLHEVVRCLFEVSHDNKINKCLLVRVFERPPLAVKVGWVPDHEVEPNFMIIQARKPLLVSLAKWVSCISQE
jgi:hypothetical protein